MSRKNNKSQEKTKIVKSVNKNVRSSTRKLNPILRSSPWCWACISSVADPPVSWSSANSSILLLEMFTCFLIAHYSS